MPDPEVKQSDPEQLKALNRTAEIFLDAGTLTFEQVKKYADALNRRSEIVSARSAHGARSEVLDALLRAYEGPIQ
jgi:hypothetical protein